MLEKVLLFRTKILRKHRGDVVWQYSFLGKLFNADIKGNFGNQLGINIPRHVMWINGI